MPDLRQTRKNIKTSLAVLLGVDVVAIVVLFSPLVGSTESRRQELNQLWAELQSKTRQVEPLANLPDKILCNELLLSVPADHAAHEHKTPGRRHPV